VSTPRFAAERDELAANSAAMEIDMLNQLLGDLPGTLMQAQSSPVVARMKRLLLITLALWMSYFLVVNWFVHALNKIAVFGIPLGTCLAVQGAAIMFAVTLFRFARSAD